MVTRDHSLSRVAAILIAAPLLIAAAPSGTLEQAVAAQRELVAERPNSAGTLNDLGNLLAEIGELEQAEKAYRRAMELDPARPEPPFNLSLLLSAGQQPREARRLLHSLLKNHPRHAWGYYQLGTLLEDQGKRRRALHNYREAFRLDPSLTDPRYNPHVLDNELATAAMIEAFSAAAQTSSARPIYVEPTRISGMLLPPLSAEPAAPPKDEPPVEEAPLETEEVTEGPDG
jgi:tetratricopeptide (TPR) repeat protein